MTVFLEQVFQVIFAYPAAGVRDCDFYAGFVFSCADGDASLGCELQGVADEIVEEFNLREQYMVIPRFEEFL